MKFKIYPTKIIHWDEEGMINVDTTKDTIYAVGTGEIYKVDSGRLPIILEGQIRIKNPKQIDVFSCILHTKAILTFDPLENPINDLIKLLAAANIQEKDIWSRRIVATPLHGLWLDKVQSTPESQLNLVCHIRDAAKARGLIK